MGIAGATAISLALANNDRLQELLIRGNKIESEGAKAIILALKTNGKLQKLDLSLNQIKSNGIADLGSICMERKDTEVHLSLDLSNPIFSK